MQGAMDILNGPVFGAVLFHFDAQAPDRLVYLAHPAAVDKDSWNPLLEDTAALLAGMPPPLRSTAPIRNWLGMLRSYYQAEGPETDSFPNSNLSAHSDEDHLGRSRISSAGTRATSRRLDEIDSLPLRVHHDSGTCDVLISMLLAGITPAFGRLAGTEPIAVDIHANARDVSAGQVDFSNAVGCFTLQFPILLHAGNPQGNRGRLQQTLQDLRNGLRAHLKDPSASTGEQARIRFVYRGAGFSSAAPALGRIVQLRDQAPVCRLQGYLVQVEAAFEHTSINLTWLYNSEIYPEWEVAAAADDAVRSLRELLSLDYPSDEYLALNYPPQLDGASLRSALEEVEFN
jgi:hypothetical protein